MSTLNLTISRLHFPNNSPIASQITASFYIRPYYPINSSYVLFATGAVIDTDGTVLSSPPPVTTIDPSQKYVIKAVNELCDFSYEQVVAVYPHCPPGYTISDDGSYCYLRIVTNATPPTSSENTISITNVFYDIFGSLIFDAGYNVNGTGTFTQISYANTFWVNGPGYPTVGSGNTSDGPQNRSGLWSSTVVVPQDIGFSVCINAPIDDTYYIGIGCDDYAIIRIDGQTIISQDLNAIHTMLVAAGYPAVDTASNGFRFWYIYPIHLTAGEHIVEGVGHNSVGTAPGSAGMGVEIYHLSPAAIAAATSYGAMGSDLIFSSKDYVGMPVQLGSDGIGYSCPTDYSLNLCGSPPTCIKIITTPLIF